MAGHPGTIYGVYKRANESTAAVYLAENGVSSTGLRPHTVYGVGRDQGVTSAPTTAMLAAAAGTPFTIPYGGAAQLQLARDVARAFIAASLAGARGRGRAQPARAGASRSRRSSPTIGARRDRLRRRPAAVPRGGRQRLVHGRASPTSPRRRSPRASPRPSTASAPSSPRASSNPQSKEPDEQLEFPRRLAGAGSAAPSRRSSASASTTSTTPASRRCEPPKAPLLFGKFANTLCGDGDAIVLPDGVGHVDARGRAGARDRPHRERRREGRRARVRRRLDVRERRLGARLPVRRRPVVPRQEPRHVLPGRPARRAARRARPVRPADPAAAERRDAAGLAHEQADLRHPDAGLVRHARRSRSSAAT